MKFPNIKGDAYGYAALGLVGLAIVWFVTKQARDAAGAVGSGIATATMGTVGTIFNTDANAGLNSGTPYAGTGPVGSLGDATNVVLGGAPQSVGEMLGGWLADTFGPQYDPNAPATPLTQAQIAQGAQATTRDQAVVPNWVFPY